MLELNVFAVVLAAGASSRMGTSKMALEWGDSTVLETTLQHVEDSQVYEMLLVTGGYRDLVEGLAKVKATNKAHNADFAAGEMISSIKLALSWLQQNQMRPDGILILPGDMPLVTASMIDLVISRWHQSPNQIVAPEYQKQRGHPVIFPFEIFLKFETLPADASPRDLIKANIDQLGLIPIDDPAVIIDVDTPAEYERYRPRKDV